MDLVATVSSELQTHNTSLFLDPSSLTQNFQLSLTAGLVAVALIVVATVVKIVNDTTSLKLATTNTNEFFNKLIGSLLIVSLSFAANSAAVYTLAIIIIATLVTELKFIEMILALIWNRDRYLDYRMEELAKQQEGSKSISKPADELDLNHIKALFHFERTYRLIFGSQINILLMLEKNTKLSRAILEAVYGRTFWANTPYKFNEYMGFLVGNNLVNYDPSDDGYYLTELGRGFLQYLASNNIPLYKGNT